MRYLITPTKNVSLAQSIIGVSSVIYNVVKRDNYSIDETFDILKKEYYNDKFLNYNLDFNQYKMG